MRDPHLSIPRAGGSNPSERASSDPVITPIFIGLLANSGRIRTRSSNQNARGSKRTLAPASGRKVPDRIPDRFEAEPKCPHVTPGWSLWRPCPTCGALGPWFDSGDCKAHPTTTRKTPDRSPSIAGGRL